MKTKSVATLTVDIELGVAVNLIFELLAVLPDNDVQEDKTWGYCWEELSSEAQDKVKHVREKVLLFLAERESLIVKGAR